MKAANSRILKNTGLLYFRLIFLTFINLYAVRVTLEALGQIDYGVFNVIASIVASLSILTGAMTSATQRFLSFHLGKEDYHSYSHTFTLLLMSFGAMAAVLVLIGECLGYFLIERWLDIPPDRFTAAYWVFQTSLVAFALGLITIPYTSSIVANERMGAFAAFSIVEGVCRLGTALILIVYGGDRLILYGLLTAATSGVVLLMSMQYCHSKFSYCRYIWQWNKSIFTQLSGYIGWNMFGSISAMLATQGQNILLNIFFGPVINAAKAIADRIQHVISGFSVNLYMAASPQIIKSYAAGELDRCLSLVLKTSKMSFLLVFVMAFPLICNMEGLLKIWLAAGDYSPDMTAFSKLILAYCLVLTLEPPISRLIQATGDIRRYQISVGVITLSFIPIAALVLWMGAGAAFTLVVLIAVMALAQVVRIIVAHRQVALGYGEYWKTVMVPLIKVSVVGIPLYLVFEEYFHAQDWLTVILQTAVTGIAGLFTGGVLGLDAAERSMLLSLIKTKLKWK